MPPRLELGPPIPSPIQIRKQYPDRSSLLKALSRLLRRHPPNPNNPSLWDGVIEAHRVAATKENPADIHPEQN